ncbi:HAD family hydrolase [Streptomonospora wellingtoniae]|uniref:HAD family hydrolase n=1 Tax=Streptomonospora wellingtoniae TaxID=3075544 RepID=A0ABU2KTD3_9ACTN|nr:HAD family hydrolase [Streptomonospora sp. DSM 45055]MDT0302363.1 HAD family hydrolase [Streptomonospora sp. DSM 45055]
MRSVVLDVGETLIDESRIFERWADRLGVPRLAFFGLMGAVLAEDRPLMDAFHLVKPGFDLEAESAAWLADEPASLRENFDADDLYADVRPALSELRAMGLSVVVAGNQPSAARPSLAVMDLPADQIHVSEDWGVSKPDPAFFSRVVDVAGANPAEILYVGDRLDNDVLPAKRAGLRAALLRRGMLGYLHAGRPEARQADTVLDGLADLPGWIADQGD